MRWITATDLSRWADTKSCETLFPQLMEKLIIASCITFPKLQVPSGDSIFKPGWDIQCTANESGPFITAGESLWELGRGSDYADKFNKDFKKRDQETAEVIKKSSAFIFVTPRRWVKPIKNSVTEALKQSAFWKDILIYDADDLELWLEQFPGVARWLALQLNLPTAGVVGADEFWNQFSSLAKPAFTSDFVICGRIKERDEITRFLQGKSGILHLQSSSEDAGTAFVVASALSLDEPVRERLLNNMIIVRTFDKLKELTALRKRSIIIYHSETKNAPEAEQFGDNHVITILNFSSSSRRVISLPIPKSVQFSEGLHELGFRYPTAHSLTKQCGRSHTVLRRMLSENPGSVSWSGGNDILELVPIFFVQKFDDEKEGDKAVVASIYKDGYSSYKEILKKWALISDHPVSQIANYWQAISSYDLLFVLGKYITDEHLQQFEIVFLKVMREADPSLELEPSQRMAAALFKKESKYSKRLKSGLSQTLVLLSVYGSKAGIQTSFDIEAWVSNLVRTVLDKRDLTRWQSVESKIDLLSEAAPKTFLEILENATLKSPELITELFDDRGADIFSPVYHTHILWALEGLAWDTSAVSRVVLLLARLSELDKGTGTANRARASLKAIFIWWYPQTFANLEIRKKMLDLLAKKNPNVCFELLVTLSPHISNHAIDSHKLSWRLRDASTPAVTEREYYQGLQYNCQKLIDLAGNDSTHWIELIGLADNYTDELRTSILDSAIKTDFSKTGKDELRKAVKRLISIHSASRKESDWNLSKSDIQKLQQIHDRLIESEVDKYCWYFDTDLIERRRSSELSYEKQIQLTRQKRAAGLRQILKKKGLAGVTELASKVEHPFQAGYGLAELQGDIFGEIVLHLPTGGKMQAYAEGYLRRSYDLSGIEWLRENLQRYRSELTDDRIASIYMAVESCPEIWSALDGEQTKIKDGYWQGVFRKMWPWVSNANREAFLRLLNSHGRFVASMNQMYDEKSVSDETIIETLKGLVTEPDDDINKVQSGAYRINKLLRRLREHNTDKKTMVMLEWQYFSALKDGDGEKISFYLHEDLSTDPTIFAQLVTFVYKPEDPALEEQYLKEAGPNIASRARNAHDILETWRKAPGMDDEGNCDFAVLKGYMEKAIPLCEQADRKKWGIYELGQLLGRMQLNSEQWPHPGICDIIEDYNHKELNRGFYFGYSNRGGIRFRSGNVDPVADKAKIEKLTKLATELSYTYPVMAGIISDVAASKKSWAEYRAKQDAQEE